MSSDIENWLGAIGMNQYSQAFLENDVDMEVLGELTEDDLHKLGVSLGHGKKLLKAIGALQTTPVTADPGRASPEQASPEQAAPERRQLTVMFCDLVDSTALSVAHDLEDYREILAEYQARASQIIESLEGYIARYMGDGLLVYFGYPQAHEDDPERAVESALRISDEINQVSVSGEAALQVRIGIATGQVVAGDIIGYGASEERAVLGETPNLAARLHALAKPGQVLISEGTYRLTGRLFNCTEARQHQVKGFDKPVAVRQVLEKRFTASRFEAIRNPDSTLLTGRDSEVMLLQARWQRVIDHEGQVVLLGGEPGIGKSRLVFELQQLISGDPHGEVQLQCSAHHGNTAYYPFLQYLNQAAMLTESTDDDRPERLCQWLESLGINPDEALPLLGPMLSMPRISVNQHAELSTQKKKEKTFELICECLVAQSEDKPLLVVIEDVHWADPTSLDLLGRLIDTVAQNPVLLIVTYRPEFRPAWPGSGHITSHSLTRLGRRDVTKIINSLTEGSQLSENVVQEIVEKTDGVPLFVEEVTRTVVEDSLHGDADLKTISIPETLQDSLVARLDRLYEVKRIVQIASVIGRDFPYSLLMGLVEMSGTNLDASLQILEQSGLVYKKATAPELLFSFKHALVQDAAYQTLLKRSRKALHARLADLMETRHQSVVNQHPELLAHHLTLAEDTQRAIDYWQQAAALSVERSAYHEAMRQLETAIGLLELTPLTHRNRAQELELLIARAGILLPTQGYRSVETESAFSRANELAIKLNDDRNRFAALRGLHGIYIVRGDIEAAAGVARSCLEIARRSNETQTLSLSHRLIGQSDYMQGNLNSAHDHLTRAMELVVKPGPDEVAALVHGGGHRLMIPAFLGQVLWLKGFPDKALSVSYAALEQAQKNFGAFTLSANTFFLCWVHGWRGEYPQVTKLAQRILSLAGEHDISEWASPGSLLADWECLATAPGQQAAERARNRLEAVRSEPGVMTPYKLGLLAAAICSDCDIESMEVMNEALDLVNRTGERWCEPELLRIRARLLFRCNKNDECESQLQQALDIAKQQSSLSFELRIATDLAQLWQQQHRLEARQMLGDVMNRFSEGFETIDYRKSKAVFEHLA